MKYLKTYKLFEVQHINGDVRLIYLSEIREMLYDISDSGIKITIDVDGISSDHFDEVQSNEDFTITFNNEEPFNWSDIKNGVEHISNYLSNEYNIECICYIRNKGEKMAKFGTISIGSDSEDGFLFTTHRDVGKSLGKYSQHIPSDLNIITAASLRFKVKSAPGINEGHSKDTIKSVITDAASDINDIGYEVRLYSHNKNVINMFIDSLGKWFEFHEVKKNIIEIVSQVKAYDVRLSQVSIINNYEPFKINFETPYERMSIDDIRDRLDYTELGFKRYIDREGALRPMPYETDGLCHMVELIFIYDQEEKQNESTVGYSFNDIELDIKDMLSDVDDMGFETSASFAKDKTPQFLLFWISRLRDVDGFIRSEEEYSILKGVLNRIKKYVEENGYTITPFSKTDYIKHINEMDIPEFNKLMDNNRFTIDYIIKKK